MYIRRARVEYDKQALVFAISGLAASSGVSIAVFDSQAKLVARTAKIDAKLWGAKLKYRLKHVPISMSKSILYYGDYPEVSPEKEAKLREWLWEGASVRQQGEESKHPDTDLWVLPDKTSVATVPLWRDYTLFGYLVVGQYYDKRWVKCGPEELPGNIPVLTSKQIHDIIELGKECCFNSCSKVIYPDPKLQESLQQFIFSNLDKPLDVKFLSDQLHVYTDDIQEIFREEIGVSLTSYVTSRRISAAEELLWQTDLSVDEVVKKVGFNNAKLREWMRTYWKCSPEKYRENIRNSLSKKIPIAFVTNEEYAPFLSTAIYSLIANSDPKKEYAIFVFYSDLSLKSIELLLSMSGRNIDIKFVDLKEQMQPYEDLFYTCAHYTKESYYRLFIPLFLGRLYERFIYLDADLVVNSDISEILTEADPEKTVNAVLNYSTRQDDRYIKTLGLDTMSYINAGVMVIDCKRYIRSDYFGKAIKCMERKEQYRYIDQDVLNQICEGDIGLLQPSWNVQWNNLCTPNKFTAKIKHLVAEIQTPRIVHFTIEKPWKVMLNEYGDYYWKYAKGNSEILERFGVDSSAAL